MPYSTPIGAFDSIEQQIRHVRRRRNLHAAQRAVYLAVATAAAAATVLLLLALRGSARLFAVAAWSVGATGAATVVLLILEASRRWLPVGGAAAWIDRRADLRGRLVTLLATRRRRDLADASFVPFLLEETVRRRPTWTAARLVPRAVPLGALAAAIAATGALLLALALAPRLRPHVPEIMFSDQPVDPAPGERFEGVPDRVVIAPSARSSRQKDSSRAALPMPSEAGEGESSALARLPGELQERIRDQLWGEAWSRMRDAMARAERDERTAMSAPDDAGDPSAQDAPGDDDADDEWDAAAPPRSPRGAHDGARGTGRSALGTAPRHGTTPRARASSDENGAEDEVAGGAPGAGAGSGTDPNLYGEPSAASGHGGDTFELGIAARVRGRSGGAGPAPGEAPPAPPDAHPELAPGQRADAAVHQMAIPAAYESLVREVFSHRDATEGAEP